MLLINAILTLHSKKCFISGILSGRLKCILGLFFNLSKFKQKLRECQSQPKQIVQSGIPQKPGDSPLTSTSLDSPDSDRRYVTPPSSVQSGVQHQSRPLSDPQALKKPIDSKSRLPVFRQNRTKWASNTISTCFK